MTLEAPQAVAQPLEANSTQELFSREALAQVTKNHIDKCVAAGKVRPVNSKTDGKTLGAIFDDPTGPDNEGIFFISYDGDMAARIGECTSYNPTRDETKPGQKPYEFDGNDPSEAAKYIALMHRAELVLSNDENLPQNDRLSLVRNVAKTLKEISSQVDQEAEQKLAIQKAIFQILTG